MIHDLNTSIIIISLSCDSVSDLRNAKFYIKTLYDGELQLKMAVRNPSSFVLILVLLLNKITISQFGLTGIIHDNSTSHWSE